MSLIHTENEQKMTFLNNLNLKPRYKKHTLREIDRVKNLCKNSLEKINLEEYIPISKLKNYHTWKRALKIKTYKIKLNRVALIRDENIITFVNTSIRI